jgi:UDP-glucose 4-epimerase
MKVLITGGAGFIGSHLADAFVKRGDQVTIIDNLSTGSVSNLSNTFAQIVEGDIRDAALVNQLVEKSDLVMHMAASLGVKTIMEHPLESISTNLGGSEVVLKAVARHNKRTFIASTSEVYGKSPKQPMTETDDRVVGAPQNYRWTYSDAKALEEAVATILHKEQGLPVTTIRFFNTVGPRQTGAYGMVLPRFVKAAKNNQPIIIHGDGSQSRVFGHVADAIEGVFALLDNQKSIGEVFNIGGSGEVTIKDLAEKVITKTNSKSEIQYISYEDAYGKGFEDMQRRVPNLAKIKDFTGWQPKRTLDQIIEDIAASI